MFILLLEKKKSALQNQKQYLVIIFNYTLNIFS